jgi:hypothetical protein
MSAVRQAFRDQAAACAALGSPLMERLMAGLATALQVGDPVADRVLGWQGDPSSRAASVPLRLAGGLHALILTGQDPTLLPKPMPQAPTRPTRPCPRSAGTRLSSLSG